MNKKRLLKLANLLEADAKNKKGIKFDLRVIAAKATVAGDANKNFMPGEVPTWDCGTVACAVGLACVSGAFKRSGLSHNIDPLFGFEPAFDGEIGWGSEQKFFGLTDDESYFLFHAVAYPKDKTKGAVGERYVAKRIRALVSGKISAPPSEC